MRRLGLDADRGLGREHRHAHPRRSRLRHPAALRAGRRSRPAAHDLRAERQRHVRAAVRRGLRRAVLVHPVRRFRAVDRSSPARTPTRVRALEERIACEITFPRLQGYRYELPSETPDGQLHRRLAHGALHRRTFPPRQRCAPIIGEHVHPHARRPQGERPSKRSPSCLPSYVLEKYFQPT